ncbi:hypothetical protein [uncultured Roseobacter sp.]|uniref:hypothetical protein n=1 Tax=uncultured Roseobacter sp. TaxID=114847 RepID=UPI002607CB8E|nr:hypothetical protein [uncultured Roseobacter sp.]
MIIAMLFNWRAYSESGNYWHEIRDAVFSTGIIQRSGRHMKLSIGDVLVGLERGQNPEALFKAAFANSEWSYVYEKRLLDGFPTVFGMVFENMPTALAEELSEALFEHAGFMGAISIHLEFPPHLALYRLSLPPHYRLEGMKLRCFYSMGNQDGCDPSGLEDMQRLGYGDTAFEDTGAGRTILGDFETPRHFERVAAFRNLLTHRLPGGEDDSYQLTMMLEDLSPKLFNALGAAAERLASAENEEELAQVAISGRRYLEQLADALFPPTDAPRGKRILNKQAYRNRLWAFAEDHLQDDPKRLYTIGKEVDRVVEELNAGLHADQPKDRVARSIADAALLTATLFALSPNAIRNGYLAYMDSLRTFVGELAAQGGPANQSG